MERVENVSLAGSVRSVDAVNVVDVVGPLCALGRAERLERGPCQVEGGLIAKRAMVLKRESQEVHKDMLHHRSDFDKSYRK